MSILHILNVADLFFMAAGVGAALLMIVVGGQRGESRPAGERTVRRRRVR